MFQVKSETPNNFKLQILNIVLNRYPSIKFIKPMSMICVCAIRVNILFCVQVCAYCQESGMEHDAVRKKH